MAAVCGFCSSRGKMSQEHVFALWPSTVGLAVDPVEYRDFSWQERGPEIGHAQPAQSTS